MHLRDTSRRLSRNKLNHNELNGLFRKRTLSKNAW